MRIVWSINILAALTAIAMPLVTSAAPVSTADQPIDDSRNRSALMGKPLFMLNCSGCHGAAAQGGDGPDLRHQGLDAAFITNRVTHGVTNEMPAFTRLTSSQISSITAYVRSLQ
jgi:mono/diheme cytochrome c family protein